MRVTRWLRQGTAPRGFAGDVAISGARSHAALYTDSRARLAEALSLRDGAQVGAIDEIMARDVALSLE